MSEQRNDDGTQRTGPAPGRDATTADDGAQLTAEQQKVLDAERGRLSKEFESKLEASKASLRDELKKEAEEAARLAALDETERAIEAKKKVETERDAALAETAALEGRIARADYIRDNGAGLDKAWTAYLDRQLAEAAPDDWEDTLKLVLADHAQSTGRKPGDVGTGGRPAANQAPEGMNEKIVAAIGRRRR